MKVVKNSNKPGRLKKIGKGLGKGIGSLVTGIIDATPLSLIRDILDTDKDGKLTARDLKEVNWLHLLGGIICISLLIRYDIIHLDDVIALVKALMNVA
jgi:hypothetical protein